MEKRNHYLFLFYLLNNLYTAEDNQGKVYSFGFIPTFYFKDGRKVQGGGFRFLNLVPHPYSDVETEQEENQKTYTVKKKSVE